MYFSYSSIFPSENNSAKYSDAASSDKELPLAPPALDSIDVITATEAQLQDCANRRHNLELLVKRHTEFKPRNPVTYDLAQRKADRERVAHFEMELADVKIQEHDLGLKLHRAWKRRQQEQPTAFWVGRHVT